MDVLVVNAGSSSLKLAVLGRGEQVLAERHFDTGDAGRDAEGLRAFLDGAPPFDAAGHRLVHGGAAFRASVAVDDRVVERLRGLADLAPLHNPPALAALEALRGLRPDLPTVACFDTAFHATLPPEAATFAVPWDWTERYGLRRYGFHGLSHAYASRRAAELLGQPPGALRVVVCHLGAGASLAAVAGGASVDTTMGFSPLDGLVMATRSGTVDPGALLWLQRHARLGPDEVERALDRASGLLGVSGVSGDLREVQAAAQGGNGRARLALGVYAHRLRGSIAAMAAALGGVDALVFTAGVGEHSPWARAAACDGLGFLGVALDQAANRAADADRADADVSAPGARCRVLVVRAREDVQIARETRRVLGAT